MRESLSL